jgi:uncharacterized protein (DUF305 family)
MQALIKVKSLLAVLAFVAIGLIGCTQDERTEDIDPDSLKVKQDTMAQKQDTSKNEFASIVEDMHKDMMKEKPEGNVDKDFAEMMAMHHETANKLAQVQLDKGKDPGLKNLSKKMKNTQTQEEDKLNDLADKVETKDTSSKEKGMMMQHHHDMLTGMNEMMQNIEQASMSKNIDSAFAAIMIEHHKSGIKMAEIEQKDGQNPEIKQMAAKIISEKKKDIQQLEKWLSMQKNQASRYR